MDYPTLLKIYQQQTGLPGSDDAFNQWVQKAIDTSHSSSGADGIPTNYFTSPGSPGYVPSSVGASGTGQPDLPNATTTVPSTGAGDNYHQIQNSNQVGAFGTVGNSTSNQQQTSGQNTTGTTNQTNSGFNNLLQNGTTANTGTSTNNQNTVGSTTNSQVGSQTGTSGSNTTGTSQQTGQTQNNVTDSLGFGQLLKNQVGAAGATDAARNAFLTDTMNTGGQQFGSQVDQAVRNSLSGPGMQGIGDSGSARASGYAAAQIGRNNLDQRLSAAGQLAGPTATETLANTGNPYLGNSQSTSGNTTSSQLTNGFNNLLSSMQNTGMTSQNTSGSGTNTNIGSSTNNSLGSTGGTSSGTTGSASTGFQNLLNNTSENQAGTTGASSSQAGAGQIPQGQPVKTGGCVLCTAAIELKLSRHHKVLRQVIRHKLQTDAKRFSRAARGYFAVFTPFAEYLLKHPRLAKLLWPMAKGVVYEELRVSGRKLPFRLGAWTTHWIGHYFCSAVGTVFPVKDYVDSEVILSIAKRENILFEVQS